MPRAEPLYRTDHGRPFFTEPLLFASFRRRDSIPGPFGLYPAEYRNPKVRAFLRPLPRNRLTQKDGQSVLVGSTQDVAFELRIREEAIVRG